MTQFEPIYAELRRIAGRMMAGERPDHTLQATALANEAFIKLFGREDLDWNDHGRFFRAAAEAMRRLLVDHARHRGRERRGGKRRRVTLSGVDLFAPENSGGILALDEALHRLERVDARMSRVVELRFFAGLDIDETAKVLGISPRTVKREWTCARAWLFRAIHGQDAGRQA